MTKGKRSWRNGGLFAALPYAAVFSSIIAFGSHAAEVRVAVAANFTAAATEIGQSFESATGYRAVFSFGSTGQLFAQIAQGAPFEVFLAADRARPQKALDNGAAVPGSGFTYATGRIVLYSPKTGVVSGPETLTKTAFRKLAIANPLTAPYGAAAVAAMKALGVYDGLKSRIVRGNNIAQTYQFVATGNAALGFVALAQIVQTTRGSRWLVPRDLHPVIAQDAVLLKKGAHSEEAKAFLAFLKGPIARRVIRRFGYGTEDRTTP